MPTRPIFGIDQSLVQQLEMELTITSPNWQDLSLELYVPHTTIILPISTAPSPCSIAVRASARGAGGRGSIPDRVIPKTLKMRGLRFSAWRLALMSQASDWADRSQYKWSEGFISALLTCSGIVSVAWDPKIVGCRSFGPNKTGPH